MQYTFNAHYNTNPGTGFEVEESYFLATNPPMVERVIIDNQTGLTLAGSYVDALTGVHLLDSEVEARIEAFNTLDVEDWIVHIIKYVYQVASDLPTGVRDPKAGDKLATEWDEFEQEIAAGKVVDAATEAADVLYYSAKVFLNGMSDYAEIRDDAERLKYRLEILLDTGWSSEALAALVRVKYEIRRQGIKDKAREYAAMAAHLGIAVEWTIRAVRVFDDENGFLQEETVSRTFHTASDALAGLWSMKDSVSYSDIKVTVQVRGRA